MNTIATIYTYGGGEVLTIVFNAVAAIFLDNEFKAALYIAALLFGFWVLISSVAKNTAAVPFQWMFWFWLITNCILYPKINVIIYDPITKHQQKVDNVPLLLGEFAAIVSGLGHGLTNLFETAFSLPDYQKYGQHGSVFASKILKNLGKYRIHDGTLKENMERFINQCVVLEAMMGGKYTVKDLQNSKDIWQLVSTNANPILGFSYRSAAVAGDANGQGAKGRSTNIVTCKEGAKLLEKDLTAHQSEAASIFGRQLRKIKQAVVGEQASAPATTSNQVFNSFFKAQLVSSYQFMSGIAENADKILRQEMMLNAIDDVKNNYAVSKAIVQQRAWHHVTGELASNFLIAMKVILETLAYTSFIFIAMLVMLPSGLTILGRYFGLLLWLQLWAPLYAVLNLVMAIAARQQSQGILGDAGLTMLTSVGLANLHADIEAIAAMASASIPFISYAITQGGVGSFMHLAGSLTSSLQGAASQSAAEISSGNLSLGNVSYAGRQQHMSSGFKHDSSFAFRSGRMEMERLDGATNFMTPAGRLGLSAGAGMNTSTWQDNVNVSSAIGQNINSNISRSQSELESLNHNYHNKQSLAFDQSTSLLKSAMQNVGQQQGFAIAGNSQYRDSFSKTLSFAEDLQRSEGYNATQTASIMAGLGMNMKAAPGFMDNITPQIGSIAKEGVKGIPSAGFEAQTGFSDQASYHEAVQKARSAAQNRGVLSSIEEGISHMSEIRFNGGKGEEQRLADNLGVTLNEMQELSDQISAQRSKVKQWTDAKSNFENSAVNNNQDYRENFIDSFASKPRLQDGQPLGRAAVMQHIANRTPEYQRELEAYTYRLANTMAEEFATKTAPVIQAQQDSQAKAPEDLFKFSAAGMEQQHKQEKAHEKYNVDIANELQNPGVEGTFKKEMKDAFDTHLKDKGWKNQGLKYGVETIDKDGNTRIDYIPVKNLEDYQKHWEQKHNILPVEKESKKGQPLTISPDFNSVEAKYRTYQEQGKPARDIASEVEAQSTKYEGQIKQQSEATTQRQESINKAYEAEANTRRTTKTLMGVADYVDAFAGDVVKTVGGNYTTWKEKREASYRTGETTAFAELEAPQRPPSTSVIENKLPDKENKDTNTAHAAQIGDDRKESINDNSWSLLQVSDTTTNIGAKQTLPTNVGENSNDNIALTSNMPITTDSAFSASPTDNYAPKEEERSLISEHLSEAKPKVIKVQGEKFDSSAGMRANKGEHEQIKQILREQGQLTEDVKHGGNNEENS